MNEEPLTEPEKCIQAAYALNMCTISVSQIVDYNDITVLEQEYEAILNNLNLQNMPKDEALLDILKRILETITFFRIQEVEKDFIEKEYRQKMKNAIWSAVSGLGLLVAGGSPVTMGIALASQVGIGYMNYRKNRAEYQAGRDRQLWQLRRTAMEQLEALQQQLFETSWRLADKYQFPDAYRLTERQIKRYNAILMDTDELRKYQRLMAVKEWFEAYPPFWYYLGNTANSIARNSERYQLTPGECESKAEEAREYYDKFCSGTKYGLLREDSVTAACCLEYAELLDPARDREKIEELIGRARSAAGCSFDVLQLCAMGYIRIGRTDLAKPILAQLVVESCNDTTNAQLLSRIYVSEWIRGRSPGVMADYKLLRCFVRPEYLFPMPSDEKDPAELEEVFLWEQRRILAQKYEQVLRRFSEKYVIAANRIVPLPEDNGELEDLSIYSDRPEDRAERIRKVSLFMKGASRGEYIERIGRISYSYELLELLNRMFKSLCLLDCLQDEGKQERLVKITKDKLHSMNQKILELDSALKSLDSQKYAEVQKTNAFVNVTMAMFSEVISLTVASLGSKTDMEDFTLAEESLARLCEAEGLEPPEVLYDHRDDAQAERREITIFGPELLGEEAVIARENADRWKNILTLIREKGPEIIKSPDKAELIDCEDSRMARYFSQKKLKNLRSQTIALIDDRNPTIFRDTIDLLFSVDGITPVISNKAKKCVPYESVSWGENNKRNELLIGGTVLHNDALDLEKLMDLIQELARMRGTARGSESFGKSKNAEVVVSLPNFGKIYLSPAPELYKSNVWNLLNPIAAGNQTIKPKNADNPASLPDFGKIALPPVSEPFKLTVLKLLNPAADGNQTIMAVRCGPNKIMPVKGDRCRFEKGDTVYEVLHVSNFAGGEYANIILSGHVTEDQVNNLGRLIKASPR